MGSMASFPGKRKGSGREIFGRLFTSPVMYTDMTGARMNGKLKNVVVCSNKKDVFYAFRDTKGDKAFEGTPVEYFLKTLVHDHDKTAYHYGGAHQECNAHHTRYLKGAEENEPGLQWHGENAQAPVRDERGQGEEGRPDAFPRGDTGIIQTDMTKSSTLRTKKSTMTIHRPSITVKVITCPGAPGI